MRRFLYILISITAALLQACADDASVPRVNATVEIVPQTDVADLTIDNEQLSFRNLTHLRMQHCRKALEDGVSVLNACTESGFPDYSSFLKTFRRLYGITPAEYRSQNRKKA